MFSRAVEDHFGRLQEVLSRLRSAGLKIKPSKCHLLQSSVRYLGQIVSAELIKTDQQSVADWPTPSNKKELKQFLGFASYYRKFCVWRLTACISQRIDGRECVVANYVSRVLSRAVRRYCAIRREILALVWAARYFRPYLYGKQFLVRTDHNSLFWLHNFKEPELRAGCSLVGDTFRI